MTRLLVVLVLVVLATLMINYRKDESGNTETPQASYKRQTEKAQALEKQMQDQADKQLEKIDATTE